MDGSNEDFNLQKITKSIWMAAKDVGGSDEKLPQVLSRTGDWSSWKISLMEKPKFPST